jgi:hypothetical protein
VDKRLGHDCWRVRRRGGIAEHRQRQEEEPLGRIGQAHLGVLVSRFRDRDRDRDQLGPGQARAARLGAAIPEESEAPESGRRRMNSTSLYSSMWE